MEVRENPKRVGRYSDIQMSVKSCDQFFGLVQSKEGLDIYVSVNSYGRFFRLV